VSAMTPVDDVVEALLARAIPLARAERLDLAEALGKILAEDIVASIDVPAADNSAMDGYALDVTDPAMHVGGLYRVGDRIAAGYTGRPLTPGTLTRIFTGAPIPAGANTVLIQENTRRVGDLVEILEMPTQADNVRPRGQDIDLGQTVLSMGRRLQPQDLGLIASVGVARVAVYEPLVVGLMSTGDELVEPSGAIGPGQIYNSNHYTLSGLIRRLGMTVIDLGLVADNADATQRALLRGAEEADCIISSGGVSVGEEDYVKAAVEELGGLDFWRIAIKPGKPLAFGNVAGVPFFGLPGNPVSSFVTFLLIARPYLLKLQGCTDTAMFHVWARANFDRPAGNRREYLRVQLNDNGGTELEATVYAQQGSGVMSSVSWANGLAEQEVDQVISTGDWLKVYPLS
jgi:molybdopterin molybdotransferase